MLSFLKFARGAPKIYRNLSKVFLRKKEILVMLKNFGEFVIPGKTEL